MVARELVAVAAAAVVIAMKHNHVFDDQHNETLTPEQRRPVNPNDPFRYTIQYP